MAKDDKTTTDETPKKNKKKLIIIIAIIIAIIAALTGGAGGYLMLKPAGATAEPEPTPGAVSVLDAITINLADGHYLKLKMTLQATTDAAEAPDGSKALDTAIALLSNRPMAELLSNQGREKAKAELKAKVVTAYTEQKKQHVMDVYFTTFVIQ